MNRMVVSSKSPAPPANWELTVYLYWQWEDRPASTSEKLCKESIWRSLCYSGRSQPSGSINACSHTESKSEGTGEVGNHPKVCEFSVRASQALAVCVAQLEQAGHLGSAGDDTTDNGSKEGDQKKVKAE